MYWDNEYKSKERLWGTTPSELAKAVVAYVQKNMHNDDSVSLLDIGCGYGRDAFYYAENLACIILGIDVSEKAIEIASETALMTQEKNVEFRIHNFVELEDNKYDIISASNLYQLLRPGEREQLRDAVSFLLKPDGLLFLSTLSVNDPEHKGKGSPIPGEPGSYQDKVYLHLCTKAELMEDFGFLDIKELYEHEYDEPRATGEVHHHISWILIAENTNG